MTDNVKFGNFNFLGIIYKNDSDHKRIQMITPNDELVVFDPSKVKESLYKGTDIYLEGKFISVSGHIEMNRNSRHRYVLLADVLEFITSDVYQKNTEDKLTNEINDLNKMKKNLEEEFKSLKEDEEKQKSKHNSEINNIKQRKSSLESRSKQIDEMTETLNQAKSSDELADTIKKFGLSKATFPFGIPSNTKTPFDELGDEPPF